MSITRQAAAPTRARRATARAPVAAAVDRQPGALLLSATQRQQNAAAARQSAFVSLREMMTLSLRAAAESADRAAPRLCARRAMSCEVV